MGRLNPTTVEVGELVMQLSGPWSALGRVTGYTKKLVYVEPLEGDTWRCYRRSGGRRYISIPNIYAVVDSPEQYHTLIAERREYETLIDRTVGKLASEYHKRIDALLAAKEDDTSV